MKYMIKIIACAFLVLSSTSASANIQLDLLLTYTHWANPTDLYNITYTPFENEVERSITLTLTDLNASGPGLLGGGLGGWTFRDNSTLPDYSGINFNSKNVFSLYGPYNWNFQGDQFIQLKHSLYTTNQDGTRYSQAMEIATHNPSVFVDSGNNEQALYNNFAYMKDKKITLQGTESAFSYTGQYDMISYNLELFKVSFTGVTLVSNTPVATPEPGTLILMGIGATGAAFMRRRKGAKLA